MRIKRMKFLAADTSKKDYIVEVQRLLRGHERCNHNNNQFENYSERADQLLKGNVDSDRKVALLLST